nr:unnamed protein product [Spirometra erinaceieuropaei]
MVGPPVSTGDRLCPQHLPLVSPLDEDIVQQVPLSRPRMPPCGLLSPWNAEKGAGEGDPVICAVSGLVIVGRAWTDAHKAVIYALRRQDSRRKVSSRVAKATLSPGATTPEEGVASTHLLQLASFGEANLAECGVVQLVARNFSNH